jgi:large subunit ribosomal protein L20
MTRAKGGNVRKNRRKRITKLTEGFFLSRKNVHSIADQSLVKALAMSFRGRKERKREFRRMWIQRINAAARLNGLSYSQFISGLKSANIDINRKVLADLAMNDAEAFSYLCEQAKTALG